MYHSRSSSSTTSSGVLEFTRHAAARYSERVSPFIHRHNNINRDSDRSLLNELNNDAYNDIEQLVKNTFPNCEINKIRQVNAPQMYGMYMLRREEMKLVAGRSVQEKLMFHVTTESRAMESLDSGLDWRRTRRSKFGCGVSFSDDADYANFYADKFTSEETRIIMICTVLVSETYVVPRQNDGSSLMVPPYLADTTMSHNGHVYVKYNDNDFYPLYFVYYRNRPEHLINSKYFHANSRRNMEHYDDYSFYNYLESAEDFDDDILLDSMSNPDENDDFGYDYDNEYPYDPYDS